MVLAEARVRLLPRYWDGSWFWPWREVDHKPVFRARRFMLDWADPHGAPRRLYYYGKHVEVCVALEKEGKTSAWSWRYRWFTRKYRWVTVHPTNYREKANTPPWMIRPTHTHRPGGFRPHQVCIGLSDKEWRLLLVAAKDEGMGPATYARRMVLLDLPPADG